MNYTHVPAGNGKAKFLWVREKGFLGRRGRQRFCCVLVANVRQSARTHPPLESTAGFLQSLDSDMANICVWINGERHTFHWPGCEFLWPWMLSPALGAMTPLLWLPGRFLYLLYRLIFLPAEESLNNLIHTHDWNYSYIHSHNLDLYACPSRVLQTCTPGLST